MTVRILIPRPRLLFSRFDLDTVARNVIFTLTAVMYVAVFYMLFMLHVSFNQQSDMLRGMVP